MINLIVAINKHGIIGKDDKIPWHNSEDLKEFKRLTTNQVVIMGRKTFDSLNLHNGLPNRLNIVITRTKTEPRNNVFFIELFELHEFIMNVRDKEIFIIGGAEIYKQLFHLAEKLYISTIDNDEKDGTSFPIQIPSSYKLQSVIHFKTFVQHIISKF